MTTNPSGLFDYWRGHFNQNTVTRPISHKSYSIRWDSTVSCNDFCSNVKQFTLVNGFVNNIITKLLSIEFDFHMSTA